MRGVSDFARVDRAPQRRAIAIVLQDRAEARRCPAAASVLIGPAEMALTRMPCGPRSAARYLTHASSAAFATPITL